MMQSFERQQSDSVERKCVSWLEEFEVFVSIFFYLFCTLKEYKNTY